MTVDSAREGSRPYRLAILNSHPIQYFAPFYSYLARQPQIALTVFFCSQQGVQEYIDPGFGTTVKWDVPLLEGYDYKFLPHNRNAQTPGGFFSLINPSIVTELRRGRFDALVVHGHNYATYLIGMAAARVLGIPVLMRCDTHLALKRSRFKSAVRKPLMTLLYRYVCTACLPIGTRNAEYYQAHGVSSDRLFLVPFSVDNRYFSESVSALRPKRDELKAQFNLAPNKPVVLFASKLTLQKRPSDLLEAFSQLQRKGIAGQLIFVDSGAERDHLERTTQVDAIQDVHFFGFRNQTELPTFYAIADVFVLPSTNERWGLVINEAMCAGLPVITTRDVGAAIDLVKHGANGYQYDGGDTEALSHLLAALVEDGQMRLQMGRMSKQIIEDWDYERGTKALLAALAYTSKARRPPPS